MLDELRSTLVGFFSSDIVALKDLPEDKSLPYDRQEMLMIHENALKKIKDLKIDCPTVDITRLKYELNDSAIDKLKKFECKTLAEISAIMKEYRSDKNRILAEKMKFVPWSRI